MLWLLEGVVVGGGFVAVDGMFCDVGGEFGVVGWCCCVGEEHTVVVEGFGCVGGEFVVVKGRCLEVLICGSPASVWRI